MSGSSALKKISLYSGVLIPALLMLQVPAWGAESGIPAFTLSSSNGDEQTWSLSLQALALMTALTLLPAFLLMMTSFTRIVIVLGILRTPWVRRKRLQIKY